MDYFPIAAKLHVVNVYEAGNETGWVTPKVLYDRGVKTASGEIMAPVVEPIRAWIDHGTAGSNTLLFWGEGGSIASGEYTLANFLVPRDQTRYRDGKVHDTTFTVFKMVPDWARCNHAGICSAGITNRNSKGCEYESLQNGTHDITDMQYIKGALIYTYDAHGSSIPDWFRVMHGIVAIPWPRRKDPFSGLFDIARSWGIVTDIRQNANIRNLWKWPAGAMR